MTWDPRHTCRPRFRSRGCSIVLSEERPPHARQIRPQMGRGRMDRRMEGWMEGERENEVEDNRAFVPGLFSVSLHPLGAGGRGTSRCWHTGAAAGGPWHTCTHPCTLVRAHSLFHLLERIPLQTQWPHRNTLIMFLRQIFLIHPEHEHVFVSLIKHCNSPLAF